MQTVKISDLFKSDCSRFSKPFQFICVVVQVWNIRNVRMCALLTHAYSYSGPKFQTWSLLSFAFVLDSSFIKCSYPLFSMLTLPLSLLHFSYIRPPSLIITTDQHNTEAVKTPHWDWAQQSRPPLTWFIKIWIIPSTSFSPLTSKLGS